MFPVLYDPVSHAPANPKWVTLNLCESTLPLTPPHFDFLHRITPSLIDKRISATLTFFTHVDCYYQIIKKLRKKTLISTIYNYHQLQYY
jgi:hypothetical protein